MFILSNRIRVKKYFEQICNVAAIGEAAYNLVQRLVSLNGYALYSSQWSFPTWNIHFFDRWCGSLYWGFWERQFRVALRVPGLKLCGLIVKRRCRRNVRGGRKSNWSRAQPCCYCVRTRALPLILMRIISKVAIWVVGNNGFALCCRAAGRRARKFASKANIIAYFHLI